MTCLARWIGPLVGLLVLACGDSAPVEVAPAPAPPEIPTVMVPQIRPSEPDTLVWLGADRVLAIAGPRTFLWEPSTDRVLLVTRTPWGVRGDVRASSPAGVVVGSHRFLAASGRWEELPAFARRPGVIFSPDLERMAAIAEGADEQFGQVWVARVGRAPIRIPTDAAQVAFSPDGRRVLSCGARGPELHDSDTGAPLARWLGVANFCEWGEGVGPIVIFDDDGARLLDPVTLTQIGAPIPDAQQVSVSPDGTWLAFVSRQPDAGITALQIATRGVLLSLPSIAANSVRARGSAVAYGRAGGAGVVLFSRTDVIPFTRGLHLADLGPDGRFLRVRDGGIVIDDLVGHVTRWTAPTLARFDPSHGVLLARDGAALFEVGLAPFGLRTYGRCAELVNVAPRARYRWTAELTLRLDRDDLRAMGYRECLARSDGTELIGDAQPITGAAARDRFLSIVDDRIDVRDIDGRVLATLPIEVSPAACNTQYCTTLRMSPDGAWVVFAQHGTLRVFDATSGERLGEASVGDRPAGLVFLDDHVLGHLDRGGTRTLFDLPTLRQRARWHVPGLAGDRTLVATPGGVLDVEHTRITRRDLNGAVLAERANTGGAVAMGSSIVTTRLPITVYGPALAVGIPVRGTWTGDPGLSPIDEILTCDDGHLVRTSYVDGELRSRDLMDIRCPGWGVHPIRDGWLAISADRPILVRPDDQWFELMVGVGEGGASVVAVRDGEVRGEGIEVLLRRAAITSEGMTPIPSSGEVDDWLALP